MGERNLNTPLMRQYVQFKQQYPQALLLMRVGDFYEAYGEDAIVVSKVLGIVLTKRSNAIADSVELCGFPYHAMQNYLPKLVRAGHKVAVCDQLEDPKFAKTIVKRGVTELVTPGVAYNEELLPRGENNFLSAIFLKDNIAGVAFIDVSTGEFKVAQGKLDYIELLLADFKPKEILLQKGCDNNFKKRFGDKYYITHLDEWAFVYDACHNKLSSQFGDKALKGFGIEGFPLCIIASGAALFYLEQNQSSTTHLKSITKINEEKFVWLDSFTIKNLEIFSPSTPDGCSLIDIVDKTSSPMGARMLRNWIALPLKEIDQIKQRQQTVKYFVENNDIREDIRCRLDKVGDLERILSRAAAGKIMPRELLQLKRGLSQAEPISILLSNNDTIREMEAFKGLCNNISSYKNLASLIDKTVLENCASTIGKGDIIAHGVDNELDELRKVSRDSKNYLISLQQKESERWGIPSLRVGYNNVFGYYLEVRNTYKEKVPSDWIRKQTLVSGERYITPELKEYEEKILGAEEKILQIEQRVFSEIVKQVQDNILSIQLCSKALAQIDCLNSFAILAKENNYSLPIIDDSLKIEIIQGRHPVLEKRMKIGEEYIANDLFLENDSQQIIILTGPNMAGKSALLRQTALIVLLAQCGSYIPAQSATLGIVDKIFTRVGASDNISQGESTFMVEMLETSTILNNLTPRSLILLDEIGRGTSTFDGMSIAWAIVEYIHGNNKKGGAKTIFATHYHELNSLENIFNRVKNFHIEVNEDGKNVIFLRKLSPGGVEHSFGIHVARMAGIPESVLDTAEKKLQELEKNRNIKNGDDSLQLSFFQLDDPTLSALRDKLKKADLNNMTPLQAFDLLREMKKELGLK